jgi:hypothetical protein
MTVKRIAVWSIIGVACALIWASPLPHLVALFVYVGFYQPRYPATPSWDAKNAYLKCFGAVDDPRQWPDTPAAACEAMYLCADEAPLSKDKMAALYTQIRRTLGCQEP